MSLAVRTLLLVMVVIVPILLIGMIIMMNAGSMNYFGELTQLYVKNCYIKLMFVQVFKTIDDVEIKCSNYKDEELIAWENFMSRDEEVRRDIGNLGENSNRFPTIYEEEEPEEEYEESGDIITDKQAWNASLNESDSNDDDEMNIDELEG
uniref:Uncharacterized protein n=1 Tax=Glossina brevipalpis TaxID=37001 RepID=A0A1A9X394_9MUSC